MTVPANGSADLAWCRSGLEATGGGHLNRDRFQSRKASEYRIVIDVVNASSPSSSAKKPRAIFQSWRSAAARKPNALRSVEDGGYVASYAASMLPSPPTGAASSP